MNVVIRINRVVHDVRFTLCDSIIDDSADFVIIENTIIVCSFTGHRLLVRSVASRRLLDRDGIDVDILVAE